MQKRERVQKESERERERVRARERERENERERERGREKRIKIKKKLLSCGSGIKKDNLMTTSNSKCLYKNTTSQVLPYLFLF